MYSNKRKHGLFSLENAKQAAYNKLQCAGYVQGVPRVHKKLFNNSDNNYSRLVAGRHSAWTAFVYLQVADCVLSAEYTGK